MIKKMVAALASASLAACGGGGDSNPQPTAKALTISMYGTPFVSSSPAPVARAQFSMISKAEGAAPATAGSDAQATVQTLKNALASRGVTANITAQVMDGTTLHQIVMGENNGLPPTPDQFKLDPSEWMIVNFQLDDMVTPASDATQQAAMAQFTQDLIVFSQRAAVAGKAVFVVVPVFTCDTENSAAGGLWAATNKAFINGAPLRFVGQTGISFGFSALGTVNPSPDIVHMGADCRTPDAYVQNLRVQSIADTIAQGYKEAAASK